MNTRLGKVVLAENIISTSRDRAIIQDLIDEVNKLREENKRLEKLLRARRQFIHLVTHELKSPIAAVENYLKLIQQGYIGLEDQEKILEKCIIRTCEERQLIEDLLDLGRIEEIESLQNAQVRLDRILQRVLDECQDDMMEKNLHLTLYIEGDIPPIRAVPELAKSIWCNLVSNALKYTTDNGEIFISLQVCDGAIEGLIRDTGIGISAEDQGKIFCEFFRGENAKSASISGTGLGLVLVKKVVEGLGGNISFESEIGAGSTFRFKIPVGSPVQTAFSILEQ